MPVQQADFGFSAPGPAWCWDEETGLGTGPGGTQARIWRSQVSGKLVLTIQLSSGVTWSGRVDGVADGQAKAEEWLREMQAEGRSNIGGSNGKAG